MKIFIGLMIPFIGTTFGSAMVFLLKNKLNRKIEKLLLGFASGVMIAASVWSLIMPSIEMANEQGIISWIPPAIGFLVGVLFLLLMDYIMPIENLDVPKENSNLKKNFKLTLAVTLHNIPEGMAVGVIFAGIIAGSGIVTIAGALALSIGIAVQNFPEGAIVSMPLHSSGKGKFKSFIIGMLSGIVEPIFAFITILLTSIITPILPYLLSFAAGAMMYVVIEELIPSARNEDKFNLTVIGATIGFVLMMILDVALG